MAAYGYDYRADLVIQNGERWTKLTLVSPTLGDLYDTWDALRAVLVKGALVYGGVEGPRGPAAWLSTLAPPAYPDVDDYT